MWYLFHLPFYPWFAISGLPQALILSYLFQKTKNTWLVLIMHTIFNSVFYVILLGIRSRRLQLTRLFHELSNTCWCRRGTCTLTPRTESDWIQLPTAA